MVFLVLLGGAASAAGEPSPSRVAPAPPAPESASARASQVDRVLARARLEVERWVIYDPTYVPIAYPNGDVAENRGVCTDVVVRAFRAVDIDLQRLIHQDILRRPAAYTTVKRPDTNIDHRRVAPMLTYMRGAWKSLTTKRDASTWQEWQPGDVIVWSFLPCPKCSPNHVGIVSDKKGSRGLPLVIHNLGPFPREDDKLDAWTVLGHFRRE
ncbi:MAG: DUF1287 domain-containing protein [Polyangiaceae bacterium]|nr:DUF1287 domain-containing protein [Polyangiaceae bacterium]